MDTSVAMLAILIFMTAIWVLGGVAQRREAFRRQVVAEYQRILACWNMQEGRSGGALHCPPAQLAATTDDPAWDVAVAMVVANRERAAILRGQVGRELRRWGY